MFVKGVLDSIIKFFEETDWQMLGDRVAEFIGTIDWTGIAEKLSEGIGAALGGLAGFLWGLIKDAWDGAAGWWNGAAFEDGKFTIQGLLEGIWEGMKNIAAWISEHIFRPFVGGFKAAFGIASPSKVMEELGGYIIQGLFNGINSMVDSVKMIWNGMKETAVSIWNSIKATVTAVVSGMRSAISSAMAFVSTIWSTVWNAVRSVAATVWGGIKTCISAAIGTVRAVLSSSLDLIEAAWNGSWTDMKEAVIEIFNGIWGGIKGVINSIIGGIEKMANSVISGINAMIGALNKVKIDIPDWVPLLGGKKFGVDLSYLGSVSIPRLATGTVVPPNREFLAVLGDNKREPEVVSPVTTMEKAFEDVLRRSGMLGGAREITVRIPVEIDGRVIFEIVKKLDAEQFSRTQIPSFQM